MAKIKFRDFKPRADRMERVVMIDNLLKSYSGPVTVRQIYYRLVSDNKIPNNKDEYGLIQDLITDARYGGALDWDAIEDRNREVVRPQDWAGGKSLVDSAISQFRLDRWESQRCYVELWGEKATLAGILEPIAMEYHVPLMINRGYSSASAMKDAADRIRRRSRGTASCPEGHIPVILYLGDHDPSGLHMLKNISERLLEFRCPTNLVVRHVAITKEQIDKYSPPPNPAKDTDSRYEGYRLEHGEMSWEVEALAPGVIDLCAREIVSSYIDKDAMTKVMTEENKIKARIKKIVKDLQD